ncbi:MAG TPA: histidine kinase [Gemmatimonadales bacterium]|nr:histidine kinase [Gemmatimonadales bacterium]
MTAPTLESPEVRPVRLRDLVSLRRLFLASLAFWTAVGLVFAGQFALMQLGTDRRMPLHQLVVGELASWMPCALLTPAIVAAALRVRAAGLSLPRVLLFHLIGAALFVVVGGALMGTMENLLPWARPETVLRAAGSGILRYLGPDLLIYCQVVAASEAFAHAWESRRRGIAAATYARQLAEARLHVLSAQLQPHFLFNTLHAISALVYDDPARAERLLARLSEMLRLTLRSGTRVETTLEEELALLRRYAEIQEARYGERLRVGFEVEPGVRGAMVPRLILQPLVENAIRHGITRRITPGRVDVRAWEGEGRLHLAVCDDGVGLPASPREGVGLGITRARLRQLYGTEQRVDLTSPPGGGAVCALSIPLRLADCPEARR